MALHELLEARKRNRVIRKARNFRDRADSMQKNEDGEFYERFRLGRKAKSAI